MSACPTHLSPCSAAFFFYDPATSTICTLSLHDAFRSRRLRSFAASWLLNALLRIFAMSIITPKRKVLRMSVISLRGRSAARSEERFSRNAETDLVCRLLLEKKKSEETREANTTRKEPL